MDDRKNYSRVNKYDKRRKTTKSITILVTIAIVLVIILIAVLIFGGKEKDEQPDIDETSTSGEEEVEKDDSNNDLDETEETTDEPESTDEEDSEESEETIEMSEIPPEEIDDPNVIEAYTANWKPIGTAQEEPHETVFDEESDDWKEMIQAIGYALKLDPGEMTIHWIGNGGEQQVNGYVQSLISDDHYTVYLTWKENKGWQPIKIERVERFIHPKQSSADTNDD